MGSSLNDFLNQEVASDTDHSSESSTQKVESESDQSHASESNEVDSDSDESYHSCTEDLLPSKVLQTGRSTIPIPRIRYFPYQYRSLVTGKLVVFPTHRRDAISRDLSEDEQRDDDYPQEYVVDQDDGGDPPGDYAPGDQFDQLPRSTTIDVPSESLQEGESYTCLSTVHVCPVSRAQTDLTLSQFALGLGLVVFAICKWLGPRK